MLAPPSALLRAKPVERGRPGYGEQPGAGGAATRVEAAPAPESLLERLCGQILGQRRVAAQVEQVPVDVVEMLLGDRGEARLRAETGRSRGFEGRRVHARCTSQHAHTSHIGYTGSDLLV